MNIAVVVSLAAFVVVASAAVPGVQRRETQRIVGGTTTTIDQYPYGVSLLTSGGANVAFLQSCAGTILTNRAILSAAHCFVNPNNGALDNVFWWRARIGSTNANSGGLVLNINLIRNHPSYSRFTADSDVTILRTSVLMVYNNNVGPASIAGTNYNLADNQAVWAIGWGRTSQFGPVSEQLRHVQIWTVNQAVCNQRYGGRITNNMLCSGWLDVGGRDQCQGDSGGPLIHNGVIVGVSSWGEGCALAQFPGINARVSALSDWIVPNANGL